MQQKYRYFLNKNNNSTTNEFIKANYMESFADAYAFITMSLSENNVSSLELIKNYRKETFKEIKISASKNFYHNKKTNKLFIYKGKFSTSKYQNLELFDSINKKYDRHVCKIKI
jgi:hypothetical protein